MITPLPHLALQTSFNGSNLKVTLDSGANVSFMSKECVERLALPILPNGQLTQLAIPKYRDSSIGEVDFTVTESTTGTVQLRMRALILAELSCECYGGQTFHHDNGVVADITNSTVSLHLGAFLIQLPHHYRIPQQPSASLLTVPQVLFLSHPKLSTLTPPSMCHYLHPVPWASQFY